MPEVSFSGPADPDPNTSPVSDVAATVPAESLDDEVTPDTELFEGGPTKAMIDAWKAQFGDVFVTEVADGKYVLWRTLRRAEYRKLVGDLENLVASGMSNADATMNNEEAMTLLCTLWPEGLTPQKMAADLAGVPSIVSQQIMEASGFLSLQVRQL